MDGTHAEKTSKKQKILHELRQLVAIFLYLALFFMVLRTYTHLILLERQISYVAYGLTLLKALALAKIILTGETIRLGQRFHDKPLIIQTLYATVVFSALALAFEIVEHVILGQVHGKSVSEVTTEILEKGWPHLAGMTLVVFVSFLPFFAFRALERAIGEGKLTDLFFKNRSGKGD
jgi:quinol-cytochrome oxidoreductase complex cytochrome b subunit